MTMRSVILSAAKDREGGASDATPARFLAALGMTSLVALT